ncbi:DUF167 family protein [Archaeoglobus neptunius]|uniref:DUF167 family protein n=1 Tax=Archaeoglobus neptunius TaxID=2798580 RepID=UPI0019292706|nr:DUF167 family protein [Archaeoglobus neptunius]
MIEKALNEAGEWTVLSVEVTPNSKSVGFGYNQWRKTIEIRLKSPPRGGRANKELLQILSEIFGEAEIVGGEKSRFKKVRVRARKEEVIEKLESLL